jgi:hypothetical protein
MARKKKQDDEVVETTEAQEEPAPEPKSKESVIRTAFAVNQREYNGVPMMVLSLEEAAESLADSRWMRSSFVTWIKDAMIKGQVFTFERNGEPHYEYKLATKEALLELASQGVRQTTIKKAVANHITGVTTPRPAPAATGTEPESAPAATRRRQPSARKTAKTNTLFVFTIPPPGKKREERFDKEWKSPTSGKGFSEQARKIMEIVAESGETELNQDALTHILEQGAPSKGLEPSTIYRRFFRFAFTAGYEVYDGLVSRKDA